jgi:NAD(P)-dependent dehydrogenase (short-subunit alcohol dehydrogenase family)
MRIRALARAAIEGPDATCRRLPADCTPGLYLLTRTSGTATDEFCPRLLSISSESPSVGHDTGMGIGEENVLLENKTAVIYGAGGAVGGAMAGAFAKEGARLFLAGRHLAAVQAVATAIAEAGGQADAAELDVLDEGAVEQHLDRVVAKAGSVDISLNAIGIPARRVEEQGMQGVPLVEVPVESFVEPLAVYPRAQFLTARAAVRRMLGTNRPGVVLMHTPEPARMGVPLLGGMGPAWAALEALCRSFSAEYAARGIRAVCIRTTGLPETATIDIVYNIHAKAMGITPEEVQRFFASRTHTQRSTTLADVAGAAVFLASDLASGVTGSVLNLTAGETAD